MKVLSYKAHTLCCYLLLLVAASLFVGAGLLSGCTGTAPDQPQSQPVKADKIDLVVATFPMADQVDMLSYMDFLHDQGVKAYCYGSRGYFVFIRPSDEVRAVTVSRRWKGEHPKSNIYIVTGGIGEKEVSAK